MDLMDRQWSAVGKLISQQRQTMGDAILVLGGEHSWRPTVHSQGFLSISGIPPLKYQEGQFYTCQISNWAALTALVSSSAGPAGSHLGARVGLGTLLGSSAHEG